MASTPKKIKRNSGEKAEQRAVITEMDNVGFSGDENVNDIPIYVNKSPLSVFKTNKDFEL